MAVTRSSVLSKLSDFVEDFVGIYEKTLNGYIERIEENAKKPGTSANILLGALDVIKCGSEKLDGWNKVLTLGSLELISIIIFEAGVRFNRNEVKKVLHHLYLFKTDPDGVRKQLVESAFIIFRSFECQFVQVTADGENERAMTKLAEDAVGRAINYYKSIEDKTLATNSITFGIIHGQSKRFKSFRHKGRTVKCEKVKWITADLFSKIGVTDTKKYYYKEDGTTEIETFGYRLILIHDKLSDYLDKPPPPMVYSYILKSEDQDKHVQRLLTDIDKQDKSKIEERLKKVFEEEVEEINEFIKALESSIEDNFETLRKYLDDNHNEIRDYMEKLLKNTNNIDVQYNDIKTEIGEVKTEVQILSTHVRKNNKEKEPFWFGLVDPLKLFIGRKQNLKDIGSEMKRKTILVICGLDGVGKSELVLKYVDKQYRKKKFFVIRIDASTVKTAQLAFQNVHKKIGLKRLEEDAMKIIVEDVYEYVGENSLFIFDNTEGYSVIEHFLPTAVRCKPYILITSNVSEWKHDRLKFKTLPLDSFEDIEAMEFIKKSLDIKDNSQDVDIQNVVSKLHNFPLALKQAIVYIEDIGLELSEYLAKFNDEPKKFLEYELADKNVKTTFRTLEFVISKIKDDNEHGLQAIKMLNIMSFCMPNNIPTDMFLNVLPKGSEGKITKILSKYFLINKDKDMLHIHGLVQKVVRLQIKEQEQELEYLEQVLDLLQKKIIVRQDIALYSLHVSSVWQYCYQYDEFIQKFIVENKTDAFTTYFHLICENSSYEIASTIINKIKNKDPKYLEALVNKKDKNGDISLHYGVLSGSVQLVELLIQNAANVNAKNHFNLTPLHFAAKNGFLDIVDILLENKANVTRKTGYKYTPLHLAARNGWPDVVELLLSSGSDINAVDRRKETSLHFACKTNQLETVKVLLNHKDIKVNVETQWKWTPLHFAAKGGYFEVVKLLLEKQADVNAKNNDKFTPLHHASFYNHPNIVFELLANSNIDINAQTNRGRTPLHLASESGNFRIVRALIKIGANVDIVNADEKTAADMAKYQILKFYIVLSTSRYAFIIYIIVAIVSFLCLNYSI